MNIRTAGRSAVALTAVMAGSLLIAPSAAVAAPDDAAADDAAATTCEITDGTLTWGIKESFRSYISGTIANGEWETSDGAEYETPNFSWSGGTGEIDTEAGTGTVSFPGAVHFTGHDGVLDVTFANPTIEFEEGTAALLMDARSTDMEGEDSVDTEQEWFAELEVDSVLAPVDDVLELADLPATLTNGGSSAFAGFYEAGEAVDPVSLSLSFDGCASEAAAPINEAEPEVAEPIVQEVPAEIPWLPIGIGAVALVVIGVTTGMLIGGRKRRPTAGNSGQSDQAPTDISS